MRLTPERPVSLEVAIVVRSVHVMTKHLEVGLISFTPETCLGSPLSGRYAPGTSLGAALCHQHRRTIVFLFCLPTVNARSRQRGRWNVSVLCTEVPLSTARGASPTAAPLLFSSSPGAESVSRKRGRLR